MPTAAWAWRIRSRPAREKILAAVPAGGFLNGLAGTALLHARLAAVDPVFAQAAVRHWTVAAQNPGPYRGAAGIFSSPGGLAASLIIGSAYLPDPDSQRAVTARAVRWLAARAVDFAHDREEHLRAGGVGTPWAIYDAINGLAGIGRVLLVALTAGYDTVESGLLVALRTLTAMIDTQHGRRPGWWLPADEHPAAVTVHPSGAATTGMAHGIAGPLSLLATAHAAGWSVAGQRAAIQSAAHWLLHWRTDARVEPSYGGYVMLNVERTAELMALHEAILDLAASAREGRDADKYGSEYIRDSFLPHFSLAKLGHRDLIGATDLARRVLDNEHTTRARALDLCDIGARSERWDVLASFPTEIPPSRGADCPL